MANPFPGPRTHFGTSSPVRHREAFPGGYCGKFARDTETELVKKYVADGTLRIEWRIPLFGAEPDAVARAGRPSSWEWSRHGRRSGDSPEGTRKAPSGDGAFEQWLGPGSNRRPIAFQAIARTN